MKQTIHIENWHPPKINELLAGRWKSAKLKKQCVNTIWASVLEQKIAKASGKRLVEIIITIASSKRGRLPDEDAFYKSTLDALVKCNMLVDDSRAWCEHKPTIIIRAEKSATTIHLTDIEECPARNAFGSVSPKYVKPKQKGKVVSE